MIAFLRLFCCFFFVLLHTDYFLALFWIHDLPLPSLDQFFSFKQSQNVLSRCGKSRQRNEIAFSLLYTFTMQKINFYQPSSSTKATADRHPTYQRLRHSIPKAEPLKRSFVCTTTRAVRTKNPEQYIIYDQRQFEK